MNMFYTHHYDSPLGGITLGSDGVVLTGLWFDGQKHFPVAKFLKYKSSSSNETAPTIEPVPSSLPVFAETCRWLDSYFSGRNPETKPKLRLEGSPFQRAVWQILETIPYGNTLTYGDVAKILAKQQTGGKVSAQAVGSAVARNPISLIVPCHRVVGAGGKLVGYAGGLERKAALLRLEGVIAW